MINDFRPAMSKRTLCFFSKNDSGAKVRILDGVQAVSNVKKT